MIAVHLAVLIKMPVCGAQYDAETGPDETSDPFESLPTCT
jgi:hypothetical protein